MIRRLSLGLLLAALPGCFSLVELEPETSTTGTTSGDPPTSTSLLTSASQTSGSVDADSSSSSSLGTTTDADPTTDAPTTNFINEPDGGPPPPLECSILEQDCPRGEKCAAWANDGGNGWNATKCVPVDAAPDGPGETCTVQGSGVSGIDSCDAGGMCWNVDPQTLEGTCIAFCLGPETSPSCEDPTSYCSINGEGVLALCLPRCNPLAPDACPEGQGCYPIDDQTFCAPDASGPKLGTAFDECEYTNACDPGLLCADASQVGVCDADDTGCCTPWCDQQAPDCPGATTCQPLPDGPIPGFESVGFCGQEMK